MTAPNSIHEDVQDYYGKALQSSKDLKSSCCTAVAPPAEHIAILNLIDDEILDKFYGCGSPIPDLVEGLTVLDLGCGTGRDCYLLSKLVGEQGRVIGVDMTQEQLDVARRYTASMAGKFGHAKSNVEFLHGYIEDLTACGIADESVDLVVSNCVINLSPHKDKVFSEIFRILRPGGELYFSDVYADRRIPDSLREDPVFYGECLGGALYEGDFRRLMTRIGWRDYRVMKTSRIDLQSEEIERAAGNIKFYSTTVRAFKLDILEDRCEDYGQAAVYQGTIPGKPHAFELDNHHRLETGRPTLVCGNTAALLGDTRLAPHFEIIGDRSVHYSLFDCDHDEDNNEECSTGCC